MFLYASSESDAQGLTSPESLQRSFDVQPASTFEDSICIAVQNAYVNAHYPVRAVFRYEVDGANEEIEIRPVFATQITQSQTNASRLRLLKIEPDQYIRLNGQFNQSYVPYWRYDNQEPVFLPCNWTGSDSRSRASVSTCVITRGEIERQSWSIHPPFSGGVGTVGLRFLLQLPEAREILLTFSSAMRDVFPPEPPTDGVLTRVYASHILTNDPTKLTPEELNAIAESPLEGAPILYERQYAGTSWEEARVDLSKYAGQTILLTLEADPGVKRDTTCDNCFWGDVVIRVNPATDTIASEEERLALRQTNTSDFELFLSTPHLSIPTSGISISPQSQGFKLNDDQFAVVTLGRHGVCDGWITIGNKERRLQIAGVRIQYQHVNIGYDEPLTFCHVDAKFVKSEDLERLARRFAAAQGEELIGTSPVDYNPQEKDSDSELIVAPHPNTLRCYISQTPAGLAFRVVASHSAQINAIQFGSFSEHATSVYFGHGYCIKEPQKFEQSGDGFGCSTSHVAFDFANGLSLLEATTRPVATLQVNPEANVYTIITRPDSRLTLRPSAKGAFDCAFGYAPWFDKNPAPLTGKKAGRFVLDYWGGSYSGVLERMKRLVNYGVTDAMLIQHVWQHYGYDVRLPDIWPPRQEQGTLEELKATQKFCDQNDIPFGLHDNYIDFYPDADGFSYDQIIFDPDGQPQKAWYNPGPDAQSYRFNPTKYFPYAERNLALIKQDLMQTAYFTDVFSSIHIMDFYDQEGRFHSRAETLDSWNRYFDLVRKNFNNNAITVSESGNDALIGALDGADAILRRITSAQENFSTVIKCEDHEYVPWFDAVNHKRMILHGVGYSERYQGGLARGLRGIESDDYISSEALTGHAVMADLGMDIRGTVRKYWLLQALARSLALDEIIDFTFVDGNIHRQIIKWKSGVTVYINRGIDDWQLPGITLPCSDAPVVIPRFGFWSEKSEDDKRNSYGGVVRLNDQVVELRVDGANYYVNGRQRPANVVTPIKFEYQDVTIDKSTLSGRLICNAHQPTDKPYAPFLHLQRPPTWWADHPELTVLPLPEPSKPSDKWQGLETNLFGETFSVRIPDEILPGFYYLLVGLYDRKTGERLSLLGSGMPDKRYYLCGLEIKGRGESRQLELRPVESIHDIDLRLAPNRNPVDFGLCTTLGAFHYQELSVSHARITPLPDEPKFNVTLHASQFCNCSVEIRAIDQDEQVIEKHVVQTDANGLKLSVDASSAFAYDVVTSN
ncbi:MAG: DUF5696 domain-containing protein [Planctomycetia bacterium]|nr:DUF5696 domain-containing protein [Planctomycetia bacterium]